MSYWSQSNKKKIRLGCLVDLGKTNENKWFCHHDVKQKSITIILIDHCTTKETDWTKDLKFGLLSDVCVRSLKILRVVFLLFNCEYFQLIWSSSIIEIKLRGLLLCTVVWQLSLLTFKLGLMMIVFSTLWWLNFCVIYSSRNLIVLSNW